MENKLNLCIFPHCGWYCDKKDHFIILAIGIFFALGIIILAAFIKSYSNSTK